MTANNPNKDFWTKEVLPAIIAVTLLFLAAYFFASCTSSKNNVKSEIKTEERSTVDSVGYWREKATEAEYKLQETEKHLKASLDFEQKNNSELVDAFNSLQDSLLLAGSANDGLRNRIKQILNSVKETPCANSVEVKPDGTIKASGVKSASFDFLEFNRKLQATIKEREEERQARVQAENHIKILESQKAKTVKKGGGFWAGVVITSVAWLAVILALFVYAYKQYKKDENY